MSTKKKRSVTPSLFSQLDESVTPVKTNPDEQKKRGGNFKSATTSLARYQQLETNKHIAHEFQSFGCHIAQDLDDKAHTSLYIKLAKRLPRGLLERSLSFVSDANADSKAKLFMWKLKQLQADKSEKTE